MAPATPIPVPENSPAESPAIAVTEEGSNVIASLCPDEAQSLAEFLRGEKISATLRQQTDEAGLEMSEVVVEPADFDRACDAAEKWQAEFHEAKQKKSGRRCPACGSWRIDYLPHDKLDQLCKCQDCQREFV